MTQCRTTVSMTINSIYQPSGNQNENLAECRSTSQIAHEMTAPKCLSAIAALDSIFKAAQSTRHRQKRGKSQHQSRRTATPSSNNSKLSRLWAATISIQTRTFLRSCLEVPQNQLKPMTASSIAEISTATSVTKIKQPPDRKISPCSDATLATIKTSIYEGTSLLDETNMANNLMNAVTSLS